LATATSGVGAMLNEGERSLQAAEQTVETDSHYGADLAGPRIGKPLCPVRARPSTLRGGHAVIDILADDRPAAVGCQLPQARELAVDAVGVGLGLTCVQRGAAQVGRRALHVYQATR